MVYSADRRFSSAITFALALLVVSIFFTPASAFGDRHSCYFFYNPRAAQEFIDSANLSDLARIQGQWFEIVVPRYEGDQIAFEYKKVSKWEAVEDSFAETGIYERQVATAKLDEYVKGFKNITRHFAKVAQTQRATMKARIKDINSLRNKIIDRAKDYTAEGKVFTFERLDDFIGVRLMMEPDTILSRIIKNRDGADNVSFRRYFAKELGFDPNTDAISKVEFKGGAEDNAKGKFYRAAHVTVRMPDGIPVEVQLMSKNTAIWHEWDHPKVYKSGRTGAELMRLKKYSQLWIRLINTFEDIKVGIQPETSLPTLLSEFGFPVNGSRPVIQRSNSWLLSLDTALARSLEISPEDRFLGNTSVLSASTQRSLIRQLAVPIIFQ